MTRCKQCHLDGHHKMSCTDESNSGRKDRSAVPMCLTAPIVEGAYYEREDGQVFGPAARELCDGFYFWRVGPCLCTGDGGSAGIKNGQRLTLADLGALANSWAPVLRELARINGGAV